jgi:hypothetical protein
MDDMNENAREQAEWYVRYFDRASEHGGEVWEKGLTTAQEWLRFIDAEYVSESELLKIIGVVHANRYRTSGWSGLAGEVYLWVQSQGVSVPSEEKFFEPEGISHSGFNEKTSLERARILLLNFETYNEEDPHSRVWKAGVEITLEWLRLIDSPEIKRTEVVSLVQSVFDNQFTSNLWGFTALGISQWCKEIGYLDLVPDDFRSSFRI